MKHPSETYKPHIDIERCCLPDFDSVYAYAAAASFRLHSRRRRGRMHMRACQPLPDIGSGVSDGDRQATDCQDEGRRLRVDAITRAAAAAGVLDPDPGRGPERGGVIEDNNSNKATCGSSGSRA